MGFQNKSPTFPFPFSRLKKSLFYSLNESVLQSGEKVCPAVEERSDVEDEAFSVAYGIRMDMHGLLHENRVIGIA